MSTTPTEILKLRRDQIEERVKARLVETGPERCRRIETALQRERAAIEARLIHQDTARYMDDEMEKELARIVEELKERQPEEPEFSA